MLEAEEEVGEVERLLALHGAALALVPKSYAQRAAEAAAKASAGAALVEDSDAVQLRALVPAAHGTPAVEAATREAVREAEAGLFAALPMPGKGRQGMPYEPTLSKEERGVERTELHHYSKFAPPVLDASMQLRTISHAINAADPARGAKDETGWQLCDRLWTEELSAALMAQVPHPHPNPHPNPKPNPNPNPSPNPNPNANPEPNPNPDPNPTPDSTPASRR